MRRLFATLVSLGGFIQARFVAPSCEGRWLQLPPLPFPLYPRATHRIIGSRYIQIEPVRWKGKERRRERRKKREAVFHPSNQWNWFLSSCPEPVSLLPPVVVDRSYWFPREFVMFRHHLDSKFTRGDRSILERISSLIRIQRYRVIRTEGDR